MSVLIAMCSYFLCDEMKFKTGRVLRFMLAANLIADGAALILQLASMANLMTVPESALSHRSDARESHWRSLSERSPTHKIYTLGFSSPHNFVPPVAHFPWVSFVFTQFLM